MLPIVQRVTKCLNFKYKLLSNVSMYNIIKFRDNEL